MIMMNVMKMVANNMFDKTIWLPFPSMMYIVDDESLIQEHPEAIVCTLWQLCPVATLATLSNAKYFRTII